MHEITEQCTSTSGAREYIVVHEYTVQLDSMFLGVHLASTFLGMDLDSTFLGVHLDSMSRGVSHWRLRHPIRQISVCTIQLFDEWDR